MVDVESMASPKRDEQPFPLKRGRGRPPKIRGPGSPARSNPQYTPIPHIEPVGRTKQFTQRKANLKPVWLQEPIAPKAIIDKLVESPDLVSSVASDEERRSLIALMAKYWSLKRPQTGHASPSPSPTGALD